jgi:uncharacterized protein YeaO (DUF488 family)
MIDHFTKKELLGMQYALITAGIKNDSKADSVARILNLYPSADILPWYQEYHDNERFRKMYRDELKKEHDSIHEAFIKPILAHHSMVIVCRKIENEFIDILTEYMEEKFSLPCIDLNKLFIEGRVDKIYIDLDEIHNSSVKLRREAVKHKLETEELTRNGRLKHLAKMNKKDKIRKLEELGITITKADHSRLNQLLIEEWVGEE